MSHVSISPPNPEPPLPNWMYFILSGSQLFMDVFINFLKEKTEPGMPRRLWSYQDLQSNCLCPSISDLGSKYLWEKIWDLFSDNFSVSYCMWDCKEEELDSKGTQIWAHPQAFKRDALEKCLLFSGEVNKIFINNNNQKYQWMHWPLADAPQKEVGAKQEFTRPTWSWITGGWNYTQIVGQRQRRRTLCQSEEQS